MTSPQTAQRLVLISVFALLGIAAYRGRLNSDQTPLAKRLWGTGVLAIMLGLVADVAPQIAGPFAVLIVVGSLTSGGDSAIQGFLGKLSNTSSTVSTAQSAGAAAQGTAPGVTVPGPQSPGPNP